MAKTASNEEGIQKAVENETANAKSKWWAPKSSFDYAAQMCYLSYEGSQEVVRRLQVVHDAAMAATRKRVDSVGKRLMRPTVVEDAHSLRQYVAVAEVTRTSADGPVECVELLDAAGHRSWEPLESYRENFTEVVGND